MAEHQNTSIYLRVPSSGGSSVKTPDFSGRAEIYFAHLAEELAFSKQGADLIVSGQGHGSLVLQGYFSESREADPVFYFADGKRMSGIELFDFSEQTEDDTPKNTESGGVGEYKNDSGALIGGLSRPGTLPPFRATQTHAGRKLEFSDGFSEAELPALLRVDIPDRMWSVTEGVLQQSGLFSGVFAVPGLSGLTYGIGAGSGNGKYGTFQIAPDGAWTYTPTTDITFMAQGRTYPETFTVLIADDGGNTVEKAFTLAITGENSAPVLTADGAATDDAAMAYGASISGKISAADPDEGGVVVGGVRAQGEPSAFLNGAGVDPNQYGILAVAPDGTWTFAATTPEQRATMLTLGPKDTLIVKAAIEAEDQYGLAGSGELTITVNGTDDAPVPDSATFFTQVNEDDIIPDAGISGTLNAHDPEGGPVTFALKDGGQGACGTLALQENGEWTYTCAADPNILNVGDVFQEVFTVLVTDKDGNTAVKDMVIAVIGQNDKPLPIAATFQHDVFENSLMRNPALSGRLDARDPEGGAVSYALKSGSASDQYGTFSLAADGAWTYTRTADVSFMAVGKTYKKSFTAIITDDNGDSVEKTFILTISGENNAPVAVAETFLHTVSEHSLMDDTVVGGRLNANDAENDDLSYALKPGSATSAYGYFNLAPDGIWTYTRTADIASLAEGQNYEETFIAVITDGKGGKTEKAFTLAIIGENDAPVITVENASSDDSFVFSGATISGAISASDPDGVAGPPRLASSSATVNGSAVTLSDYGELAVNTDGSWTFTATTPEQRENILALGPDDALAVTVILEATDDKGATGRGTLTVSIKGTDNEPVPVDAAFAAATSENALMSGSPLAGTLKANDPEGDEAMFFLYGTGKGAYGTLSLNQNGDWTYARNKDLTFMAEDETYTDRFTIYISDFGNIVAQELVVAITGDNDAPVITVTDKSVSDAFIASGAALNGTISAFDPDDGDAVAEPPRLASSSATINGDTVTLSDYGEFVVTPDGSWTFTATTPEQRENTLALGPDDTLVVAAILEAADDKGATGRETLTVAINGTDNEPVPTAAAFAAATNEHALMGGSLLAGTLEANDPEGGAVMFFLHGTGKGAYGTLSLNQNGDWTYARNKDLTFMAEGGVYAERFTIYISDLGNIVEQDLLITLTGDNDTPVITVTDKSADDSFIASGSALGGTISAFDPDDGDSVLGGVSFAAVSATVNGGKVELEDYGALHVNADGTWSFRAETQDQKGNVLALGEGDALVVKAVLEATDGKATGRGTLTVAINGTDNHPVTVGASFTPEVQEHALMRTIAASGVLEAIDPEGVPVAFSLSGDGQGDYGTFQVNADGTWIYTLGENISFLAEGETRQETFTVSVTDGNGTRTETFTLTINGENDAPVITVADASSDDIFVLTGGGISGNISASDPDGVAGPPRLASSSVTLNGHAVTLSDYGEFAVNADGTWTLTATTPEQRGNILALGPGDALVVAAILESTDDKGATGRGTLTVDINGTDNDPVPTAAAFAAATSEHALMSGTLSGTLEAKDPEGGDLMFSLHGMGKGAYGTLSLNQNGDWTYARNKDLAFMAEGEVYTERFTIYISDGANTVEKEFSLAITGDNDAPVLAGHAVSVAEEWISSGVALTGVITGTDPDQGDAITYSLKDGSVSAAVNGSAKNIADYGAVTVNSDGTWTFTAQTPQQQANMKALGAGETLTITAAVTGKDTGGLTGESALSVAVNGFTPESVTALRYEDETLNGEEYSGVYKVEGATKYTLEDDSVSSFITISMENDGTFAYSFTEAGEDYFSTLNAGSDPFVAPYTVNVTLPNGAITQRTLNIAVSPTNAGNDRVHITNESIADGLAQKIRNPFDSSQSADTSDRTFYLDRSDGTLQGDDAVIVSSYLPNIKVYAYGGNDSLTAKGPMRGSVYDLGGGANTITLGAMDAASGATGNLVRSAAGTLLVDGGFVSLERKVGMLAYNSGQNVIEGALSGQKMAGTATLSVESDSEPEAFAMYSENGVNIVRAETVNMTAVSSATATGMLGEDASGYNRIEAQNVNINVEGAGAFGLFARGGRGAGPQNVVEASETVTVSATASGSAIGIQASDAANVVQSGDVGVWAESASGAAIGMAAAKGSGHVGSNSLNASGNVLIAVYGKSALGVLNELGGNPLSRNEVTAGGNVVINAVASGSPSYGILNNSGICAVTAEDGVTIKANSGGSESGFGIYSAGTTQVATASGLDILAEGNRAVGVHALKKGEVKLAGEAFHLEVLASGGTEYTGFPPSSGSAFNGPGQAGGLLASDGASLRGEFGGSGTSGITVKGAGEDLSDREIAALCSWSSGSGKSSITLGGAGNTMASGTLEISASAAREVYGFLAFGGENTLRFNNVSIDATSTDDAAYALWTVKTDTGTASSGANVIEAVTAAINATGANAYGLHAQAGSSNTVAAGVVNATAACTRSGGEAVVMKAEGGDAKNIIEGFGPLKATIEAKAISAAGSRLAAMYAGNGGSNTIAGYSSANTHDLISLTGDVYSYNSGTNTIATGAGNDWVYVNGNISGTGNLISTGSGNDIIHLKGPVTGLVLQAGAGTDLLVLEAENAFLFGQYYRNWIPRLLENTGHGIERIAVMGVSLDDLGWYVTEITRYNIFHPGQKISLEYVVGTFSQNDPLESKAAFATAMWEESGESGQDSFPAAEVASLQNRSNFSPADGEDAFLSLSASALEAVSAVDFASESLLPENVPQNTPAMDAESAYDNIFFTAQTELSCLSKNGESESALYAAAPYGLLAETEIHPADSEPESGAILAEGATEDAGFGYSLIGLTDLLEKEESLEKLLLGVNAPESGKNSEYAREEDLFAQENEETFQAEHGMAEQSMTAYYQQSNALESDTMFMIHTLCL